MFPTGLALGHQCDPPVTTTRENRIDGDTVIAQILFMIAIDFIMTIVNHG